MVPILLLLNLTYSKASSKGSFSRSSRIPPSIDLPHRFLSILYFLDISLILIPFSLAKFISLSLERFRSRIGAMIFKLGFNDLMVISKRI
jgi:hypothetical protein